MTSDLFIKSLSRLIKDAPRKVFWGLDRLRAHHGKDVKKRLEENREKAVAFPLPSYSPELNPEACLKET